MTQDHSKQPSKTPVPKLFAPKPPATSSAEPATPGPDESGEKGASHPPAPATPLSPEADVEPSTKGAQAQTPRADEFESFPTFEGVLEALAEAGANPTKINRGSFSFGRDLEYEIVCPWPTEHPEGRSSQAVYVEADLKNPFGQFRCACEHAPPRNVMDLMDHIGILDKMRGHRPISAPQEVREEAAKGSISDRFTPAVQTSAMAPVTAAVAEPLPEAPKERGDGGRQDPPARHAPPFVLESPPPLGSFNPADAKASADSNPFRRHSLRGRSADLKQAATQIGPLPGKMIFTGLLTTIYAAPGTGKTLIIISILLEAIRLGLIDPDCLYYLNADDNGVGLATKTALFEEAGAHMIAPGQRGFKTGDLVKLLVEATEGGFASGMCLVFDTLKKFTDLMDKKRTAEFAQICRLFVAAGGTIISIAHTTKNDNADGTPRYQGTTDMLEDGDATYVAQLYKPRSGAANKVVKFVKLKNRADSPEAVAYTYAVEPGLSYEGMVASVQPIDPDELDNYVPHKEATVEEGLVINALVRLINGRAHEGKMALARAAAEECSVSVRAVIGILERYTGDDAREHYFWTMRRGHRGVMKYELLPPPE